MDQENRIVALIDMDCFYCQVEEKLNPELKGKPIAVVQYNPWKGGGIIAVNYVARAMGVSRHHRGNEAKEKCPDIQLCSVPCLRGKADISKYREAGKDVAKVLQKFTPLLERASIDEAYLDITAAVQKRLQTLNVHTITSDMTPNTFALGYDTFDEFMSDVHSCSSDFIDFDYEHSKQLLVGTLIVSEIRAAVYEETGYTCSAGIAHNKILAKLVCGMNKPNKQTVLPKQSVNILYKTLSIKKVKHLGGKFGDHVLQILNIKTMGELQQFSEKELQTKFDEKNGLWLFNVARGIDLEPVQARFNPKSIGCCKQFKGKSALTDVDSVKKWLKDLGDEIEDRLEKDSLENNRTPRQMVVSFSIQLPDGRDSCSSRSHNFVTDDDLCGEFFWTKSFELLMESAEGCKPKEVESYRRLKAPIKFLGISVGKFEDHSESKKTKKIKDYFTAGTSKDVTKTNEPTTQHTVKESSVKIKTQGKDFKASDETEIDVINDKVTSIENNQEKTIELPLDKQESFFARYLNGGLAHTETNHSNKVTKEEIKESKLQTEVNRSTTPICNVIPCGEDSNDTIYSGSTIDEEINKSIALFEEDPNEVARVSHMREILKRSNQAEHMEGIIRPQPEIQSKTVPNPKSHSEDIPPKVKTLEAIVCPECGKAVSVNTLDEHADYHLALKLREEERQQVRKERDKDRTVLKEPNTKDTKKKVVQDEQKLDSIPSISNFFTKLDDKVPTKMCMECGKKVFVDKFSEHLDFHEAQKLSRELNNRTMTSSTTSIKRKKKSASPVKKAKVPCKSIDLFFR
ncbi:unnamed protein product, partial [Brenthis ino]